MGVIKFHANCSDFNKNSKSMVLMILLTLIITVGKIIVNYHFNDNRIKICCKLSPLDLFS